MLIKCIVEPVVAFKLLIFFFKDPASTEIYTLSLHDALPISSRRRIRCRRSAHRTNRPLRSHRRPDRKSTRLNSSHVKISYAVFCLKKKTSAVTFTAVGSGYSFTWGTHQFDLQYGDGSRHGST